MTDTEMAMETTNRKELSFPYGDTVIRFYPVYSSRRKTAEIAVVAPGEVVVTAPEGKSDEELISVARQKARWITQQLFRLKDVRFQPVVRELVNGESLLYLGRNYRLNLVLDEKLRKPSITLLHGVFQIRTKSMEHEYLRPFLVNWYRVKAALRIKTRIAYFAPKLGVEAKVVRIKEQEKRWGSCAKDGTLYFNWRGVLAPAHILDYIVVHELCHLIEQRHSSRFWSLLSLIHISEPTRL